MVMNDFSAAVAWAQVLPSSKGTCNPIGGGIKKIDSAKASDRQQQVTGGAYLPRAFKEFPKTLGLRMKPPPFVRLVNNLCVCAREREE